MHCFARAMPTRAASTQSEGQRQRPPQKLRLVPMPAKPKKSLGQHFMVDKSVVDAALKAAAVSATDKILEIGPGTGFLTTSLVASGAEVLAVEKDHVLAEKLLGTFEGVPRLRLIVDDVLRWLKKAPEAKTEFPAMADQGALRAKVVANLPYNITTDTLKRLLPMGDSFSTVVLLVQEELAQRLVVDKVSTDDSRTMSLMVRYYSNPRYIRKVPPSCFSPPPAVDSALVAFDLKRTSELPQVASERAFWSLVRASFSSRRKMLRNNLRPHNGVEEVEGALVQLGLSPTARPQELTLEEFLRLYAVLGGPWNAEAAAPKRVRLAKEREAAAGAAGGRGGGDDESSGGEGASSSGAMAGEEDSSDEDDEEEDDEAVGRGDERMFAAAIAAGETTAAAGGGEKDAAAGRQQQGVEENGNDPQQQQLRGGSAADDGTGPTTASGGSGGGGSTTRQARTKK